eukprot:m.164933 g.164933  ORF g.164933 m.164933 type:complete len:52 (-) comp18118_c0_seq1:177-332(-)
MHHLFSPAYNVKNTAQAPWTLWEQIAKRVSAERTGTHKANTGKTTRALSTV